MIGVSPSFARRRAILPVDVGFAGALQADDHVDRRRLVGGAEARLVLAEELDHFVAHDFDDLLRGGKRGEHFLAHGLFLDRRDEFLGDAEVDIGFEECDADLAQCGVHILFGEFAFAAQVFEDALLEFVAEVVEHGGKFLFLACGHAITRDRSGSNGLGELLLVRRQAPSASSTGALVVIAVFKRGRQVDS